MRGSIDQRQSSPPVEKGCFDDSGWSQATSYGSYGTAPWFTGVAGFPPGSTAEWIWTANTTDNPVYLRWTVQAEP